MLGGNSRNGSNFRVLDTFDGASASPVQLDHSTTSSVLHIRLSYTAYLRNQFDQKDNCPLQLPDSNRLPRAGLMHSKLTQYFERRSRLTVVLIAITLTILLGALDVATSIEMHFLLLYLVPIFLGTWFVSRDVGVSLAIFGSLAWSVADFLIGRANSSPWIAYWNLLMRTGVFVAFAFTQASLKSKLDELSHLASRDFLTGLPNGRAFYELAAKEMSRASGLEPMTLACIDVSGIQSVNERLGYPTGDQVMCAIAHTIRQTVARPDLVGRLAGTTFALLLPKTASSGANVVLEQLHDA
ncbi:MAG TPA: GGDEF domain-containing protein, partial [Candidatus Binatia bacterium]|nr:GGDEF domain-containing protein [Candidatus Binatia bacterium]